jgi:hypothetical protein
MIGNRARLGASGVALAAALIGFTGLAAPSATAAPAQYDLSGWRVIGQTSEPDSVAGEGVATVRAPGKAMWIDYTDGATIPAPILAQGWGHIGDPDSWHGYVFDPYQQPATVTTVTEKMFMVTTPAGQQYEYTHQLSDDEIGPNAAAYDAVSPDGQWMVSSELAPVTRLLVFPTPLLNKATPPTGGNIANSAQPSGAQSAGLRFRHRDPADLCVRRFRQRHLPDQQTAAADRPQTSARRQGCHREGHLARPDSAEQLLYRRVHRRGRRLRQRQR